MIASITMKRTLTTILAIVILGLFTVVGSEVMGGRTTGPAGAPVANTAEQVRHGAYLARAGNCMGCHTVRGGKEYAGGRALATPFGHIYTSNLTPDAATGLGSWTADDFWGAIHHGKSKDGSFLYPAFPFPNYTKVTRADADAMFAYFRTLAPVQQQNREPELRFPYNQRILLAFWRTLYFTPGEYRPQPGQGAEWNRGAYLVQGLGHCSACHAARNALGGSIAEHSLGGGIIPMQNWYASSLGGMGDLEVTDVADLLKTGTSQRGAVFGPMAEVVGESLQHVSGGDIHAMATYLKSLPASAVDVRRTSVQVQGDGQAILRQGAGLYEQQCATCHGATGEGMPPAYPRLAGNRHLAGDTPINLIRIVLNGGYPPGTGGNPRPYGMPPFGHTLSDAEVAAVASYVGTSWGNRGGLVSAVDVSRLRGAPAE
jgi:mono/diheme cytochrome c family protein